MKRILPLLLALVFSTAAFAQSQLSVKAFYLDERDQTANTSVTQELDQNGEVCALVKVQTTLQGLTFDAGTIGVWKTEQKTGEVWVYLPHRARRITIQHQQAGTLRNYEFPIKLESARTYIMELTSATIHVFVEEEDQGQFVVFKVSPTDAVVTFDNKPLIGTNGEFTSKLMAPGTYDYRVERAMYHSNAGKITVSHDKVIRDIRLKPNFGNIEIKGSSSSGATIVLDNAQQGTAPKVLSGILSGRHNLKLIKELYAPFDTTITVHDEQTTVVAPTLRADFARLILKAAEGDAIFINGSRRGTGSVTDNFASGALNVEVQRTAHRPAKKTLTVSPAMNGRTIDLPSPTPIYGKVVITSTPPMAQVKLDGTAVGETPLQLSRVLIGTHRLELSRNGYGTFSRTVTVEEGKTSEVAAELKNTVTVTFNCNAPSANIYVDGQVITGSTAQLSLGQHNVRATASGYEDYSGTFTVAEGSSQTYNITMKVEESRYASQGYMRVNRVEFRNTAEDGKVLTGAGSPLKANEMRYIKPTIYYDGLCNTSKEVIVYVKIYNPDGTLKVGSSSPAGYSYSNTIYVQPGPNHNVVVSGWGNATQSNYTAGSYRIELWVEGKKIYSTSVYIYPTNWLFVYNVANQIVNSTMTLTSAEGTATFRVNASDSFTARSDANWLAVKRTTDGFSITYTGNQGKLARTATVTVTTNTFTKTIKFTQPTASGNTNTSNRRTNNFKNKQHLFLNATAGYPTFDPHAWQFGGQFAWVPRRLGLTTMALTDGSSFFGALGPVLRLGRKNANVDFQLYGGPALGITSPTDITVNGVVMHTTSTTDTGSHWGADLGIRLCWKEDVLDHLALFDINAGMSIFKGGVMPHVGIGLGIPTAPLWLPIAGLSSDWATKSLRTHFASWFVNTSIAYDDNKEMPMLGLNVAYVPAHIGFQASAHFGDGMRNGTANLVLRLTGESNKLDFQLYGGFGHAYDGSNHFAGNFGLRFSGAKNREFAWWDLTLGSMVYGGHLVPTVGIGLGWALTGSLIGVTIWGIAAMADEMDSESSTTSNSYNYYYSY